MRIRQATAEDLAQVRSMMQDEHAATSIQSTEHLLLARIASGDIYVAEPKQQANASTVTAPDLAGVLRIDKLWSEATPLLAWAFVKAEYLNRGILQSLVEYAEQDLKQQGYAHALYSACESRPHMIKAFIARGLKPSGTLTFPNGLIEHFFWKSLD